MRYFFAISVLMMASCFTSCRHSVSNVSQEEGQKIDSLIPAFSKNFDVAYYKGYKLVHVYTGDKHSLATTYILHDKDVMIPAKYKANAIEIVTPVTRVACMSTTHIGAMKLLDTRDLIVVVANRSLIYDTVVRAMMDKGMIKDAGKDYQPDYEMIAQSKPDLMFSDGENSGSSQMLAKMKAMGIRIVSSRDYFEQNPLARAEWIKFFAAFVSKEKAADSIFGEVRGQYEKLKEEQSEREVSRTVFCNMPYNGIWYMPCGQNYIAMMIEDAGGDFLWKDDKPVNGLNLTLNFEQVYQRAADADVWLNTGVCKSLNEVAAQDAKFKLFKAFKNGEVYNCTKRISAGGGMDIWETGLFRPDIVLSDLTLITGRAEHKHELYYYEKLK